MKLVNKGIAVLLCVAVLGLLGMVLVPYLHPEGFLASAQARQAGEPVLDATLVKTIQAPGLKDIILLGDQKTFILQMKDAVYVYRVDYVQR
jgi:hypothetical protein